MHKKDDADFENSTKCWICDNDYVYGDVKVRDHCYITRKVNLNVNVPIVFHNLNHYNSHLVMQGLAEFDFKVNVIPNELEKCMNFNIINLY